MAVVILDSSPSVSYTHLDVYKRQVIEQSEDEQSDERRFDERPTPRSDSTTSHDGYDSGLTGNGTVLHLSLIHI